MELNIELNNMNLIDYIRNVPDWPIKGVQFKDITTLCKVHEPFKESCDRIANHYKDKGIQKVAAIEARGFIFGGAIAYLIGAGFVLIRKEGKLPSITFKKSLILEYGKDTIEMHVDGIQKDEKVLLFDDLLATGGTTEAAIELIEKAGGIIAGIAFVIELTGSLHGREKLKGYDIFTLLEIPVEE